MLARINSQTGTSCYYYIKPFANVVLAAGGAVGYGDDWTRNGDRC